MIRVGVIFGGESVEHEVSIISSIQAMNKMDTEKYEIVPICPEVLGGLPTPRIPSEIINNKVINQEGTDVTLEYITGANKALQILKDNNIKIAILKAKSPSCGKGEIYDGTFSHTIIEGNGITAKLFLENDILVLNEYNFHQYL